MASRNFKTSRSKTADALRSALASAPSAYQFPAALPVLGVAQWQAGTAYSSGFIAVGNRVYNLLKAGTSAGGSGPSGFDPVIQDGTCYWSYVGYLAPVAYANSQSLYADQLVYNAGKVFRATNDGTTASSGSGPTPGSLTDGGVTFAYEGPQTLPLITNNGSASSGFVSRVAWDSPKVTVFGGTLVRQGANARAGIASRSGDGLAYSESNGEGGGSIYIATDAPKVDYTFTGSGTFNVWVGGQYLALVHVTTTSQRYLTLDFSAFGRPRVGRVLRFEQPFSIKFAGFFATNTDSFWAYTPRVKVKGTLVGDSFAGGSAFRPWCLLYSVRLAHLLGIEDFRVAAIGGTGVLATNGSLVNYRDRFTQDVINQAPDLVIIQQTANDAGPINASTETLATLAVAQQGLIDRVKNELPLAHQISLGVWNNRGPLASAPSGLATLIDAQAQTIAASSGVPFIYWGDYLDDGGFVSSVTGTGNSSIYTGDGTHPTCPPGDSYRAQRLLPQFADVIAAL